MLICRRSDMTGLGSGDQKLSWISATYADVAETDPEFFVVSDEFRCEQGLTPSFQEFRSGRVGRSGLTKVTLVLDKAFINHRVFPETGRAVLPRWRERRRVR